MIVLPASAGAVGATTASLAAPVFGGAAPGSSPPGRSYLSVHASTCCPPRSSARVASCSGTRFAPALTKAKSARRRRGGRSAGGGDDNGGDPWGDLDWFFGGPFDGVGGGDAGGGAGDGRGRCGGRSGGGTGGGGWDRSNSEFGGWPAIAGAAWVWQAMCAASLAHSLLFLLFPGAKDAEPAVPPFPARATAGALC